jgi:hypothetical protein
MYGTAVLQMWSRNILKLRESETRVLHGVGFGEYRPSGCDMSQQEHMADSTLSFQAKVGQIMALAFRQKSLKPCMVPPSSLGRKRKFWVPAERLRHVREKRDSLRASRLAWKTEKPQINRGEY